MYFIDILNNLKFITMAYITVDLFQQLVLLYTVYLIKINYKKYDILLNLIL